MAGHGGMEVVKTRSGWAVQFETGHRTDSFTSRLKAQKHMERVAAHRATVEQAEAERAASVAALLARRGIGPVDYRLLQPGDLFTWRPEVPPKVVTKVQHFENGASLILWEPDSYTPPWEALTLMTPQAPAYGKINCHG
jgi:hypothetical protein